MRHESDLSPAEGRARGSAEGLDATRVRARRLGAGFLALVAATFGLIVLGALVRAHGAGLACPDWPLCFGELVPRFDFHIAFEWGHRAVAGTLSLAFAALSFLTLREPALRECVGAWVWAAVAILALQVVLGGLTVLHLLAAWTVTSHLVTGNAFAATLLSIALRLRALARGDVAPAEATPPALRALVAAGGVLLVLQLVLGGLVSSQYAGLACPDWPSCADGVFFPSLDGVMGLQIAHRMNGYALAATLLATAFAARGAPTLARPTALAAMVVLLQIALGVANVWLRVPVEITALHSAGAAALVLLQTACLHVAFRSALPAPSLSRSAGAAAARAGG